MTDTTICAIVRDELAGIVEWIAYYKSLGSDALVIYDNDSTDGTERILAALHAAGEIARFPWPSRIGSRPQTEAYAHALSHACTEWIGFFDCDEFLVLPDDDELDSYLDCAPADAGAIAVNWRIFGDSGQNCFAARPVIERFTRGADLSSVLNHSFKTLARRRCVQRQGIHDCTLSSGHYVTGSFRPLRKAGAGASAEADHLGAILNHYVVKSREEWQAKLRRGHANRAGKSGRRAGALQSVYESLNDNSVGYDDIARFVPGMRREADRLLAILRRAGLEYPVWPFVEASGEG